MESQPNFFEQNSLEINKERERLDGIFEQEKKRIENLEHGIHTVSYTHLTLPTTPYV